MTDVWQDYFQTFITQVTTDSIVMWVTRLNIVDWVYFKTQILLATLRTQNLPRVESYVFSEVEHLSPSVGCARNRNLSVSCSSAVSDFIFWMLDCAWMDHLLSTFGTW